MRFAWYSIPMVAVFALGCFSLHAHVPGDVVRQHVARENGVELGAICSHEGDSYSEGAVVAMGEREMACDAQGRWTPAGA